MLAVITSHFNFAGYARPRQNLWRFLRQMRRDGVPVFGVEVYLEGAGPITEGVENWVQVQAECNQVMWQKEAALNLAAKYVPPQYTSLAWIDADVWFDRRDWVEATKKALERHDVVQMFERAILTDRDGSIMQTRKASGISGVAPLWDSHPGLAWAMRRELWQRGDGLYPYAVMGGADGLMCLAFFEGELWDSISRSLGANKSPYLEWSRYYSGISVGAVPMTCFHEWHGAVKDRSYYVRTMALDLMDAEKHLKIAENGLVEYTAAASPDLMLATHKYYYSRREDG